MFIFQKNRVISAVAIALLAASFGSQAAGVATTGLVTVTATVVNNTCEWKSTNGDQTVVLGSHNLTAVLAGTEISKPFTLELTNCPASIVVKARISGTENGGLFTNASTVSPAATNIGVSIWSNKSGTPAKVTNGNDSEDVTTGATGTHDASLPFIAKLEKASSGTPTAGDVSVPITMTIVYP